MKRLLLLLAITLCWCGNDAFGQRRENALHQGIYTHGSVGRSNTGDVMTIEKQLLNIEFYGDYIMINGSKANLLMEVDLPPNTKTVSLPAGRHVKIYQQVVEGLSVQYMVDANYNMEALWVKKNASHYFFPIEKGNTLSTGGYSGGTYNNGGTYVGGGSYSGNTSSTNSSTSTTRTTTIPRTKCPNCTNGRRVYESSYGGYSGGLQSNMQRCSECGITYDAKSRTHRHDRCNTCHGKGYLD